MPGSISSNATLEGVVVLPLKKVRNERGFLMELQRNDEPDFPGFGQIYFTQTLPGIVKAWYRHQKQVDQIAIVAGKLRLVLFDSRPESPTYQGLQEIVLDDENPALVRIPTGLWHGFTPAGEAPALLAHLNTEPFNAQAPDEERIPFDDTSVPYQWSSANAT